MTDIVHLPSRCRRLHRRPWCRGAPVNNTVSARGNRQCKLPDSKSPSGGCFEVASQVPSAREVATNMIRPQMLISCSLTRRPSNYVADRSMIGFPTDVSDAKSEQQKHTRCCRSPRSVYFEPPGVLG